MMMIQPSMIVNSLPLSSASTTWTGLVLTRNSTAFTRTLLWWRRENRGNTARESICLESTQLMIHCSNKVSQIEKPELYILSCVKLSNQLNNAHLLCSGPASFNQNSFKCCHWTKLIIFNQCFLSNCRISIEHISTSNGLYLLHPAVVSSQEWKMLTLILKASLAQLMCCWRRK